MLAKQLLGKEQDRLWRHDSWEMKSEWALLLGLRSRAAEVGELSKPWWMPQSVTAEEKGKESRLEEQLRPRGPGVER